jgi:hypothetical protein
MIDVRLYSGATERKPLHDTVMKQEDFAAAHKLAGLVIQN